MTDDSRNDDHSADATARASHLLDGEPRLKPSQTIGNRFVIVQFLAQGGMGEVYEAADLLLQGKHCALKTLRSEIAHNSSLRSRFEREVLLAREVQHPNVCPTYDLFHIDGPQGPITFLTMKLLRGESLLARLQRSGPLEAAEVLPIARQMASALDAAHGVGVIHRDFKPGNVMLDYAKQGEVRVSITDFGLSRAFEADPTIAETGHILGTPGYIAPELLQGQVASFAADVYAFGVVLYQMLTGRRPVNENGSTTFAPPSSIAAGLDPIWDKVVLRCLELDPGKRYASAGAAIAAIEGSTPALPATTDRLRPQVSLTHAAPWIAGGIFAILLVLAVWLIAPKLSSLLHPLPEKRFVALMAWPPDSDSTNRPLLKTVLDTIGSRLARAETSTKDLLIISPGDVSSVPAPTAPVDAIGTLGANLVLVASMHTASDAITLNLAVLDPATSKQIRKTELRVPNSALSRMGDRAAVSAANLLDVALTGRDEDDVATVLPAAYQSFAGAEELFARPNDTGLDQAIERYQKALDLDSSFGLAYARLSMAYSRKFQTSRDRAALSVADRNANLALRYRPASAKAVLSRAIVDMYSGKTQEALDSLDRAMKLAPWDPQILLFRAQALRNLDRPADEEAAYRQILKDRPNYWPAYNELAFTFYRQGHYQQAADIFAEGSAVAPHVATLLANQGAMYLLLNEKSEAAAAFSRSLEQAPNELAYANLGNLAFQARDYRKSLDYYTKARDIKPRNDVNWRNLGDCYAMLGDAAHSIESYSKAAELVSEALRTNPTRGASWMNLAFYEAKLGHAPQAEAALHNAEARGASELQAQFKRVQILALLGKKAEALRLLLECMDKGLSQTDVELAVDLKELRNDPRYLERSNRKESR